MKKRERGEDENGGPQGKRAAVPRAGESSEGAANNHAAANGQRLTTDDALAYLKAVKEKFQDNKEKYDEFLLVMKDFKALRVDTAGVIKRVKDLFKGHNQLILGFNTFLPRGYEITMPPEEDKKQPAVEFDQAINYVNKIKARFQADEHVYKAFLEILNMYRKGNKSINEVYQEVATLFANHGDLLEEFTYFLPGSTGPSIVPAAKPVQQGPRQRDEKGSGMGGKHPSERLMVPKKEKSGVVHGERGREREPERRLEKDRKKTDKERDRKDVGDRKERGEREEGGREKDKDFAEQKPKRVSARNASDAIRRQSQAGEGGEGFAGAAPQASTDDKKAVKSAVQYPFFDKVKSRLRSRDTYQEFLKCLNIFSQEIISRGELQSLVGDILGKHADLMEGFNEFLSHCESVEGYLAGVFSGRKLGDFAEGAPLKTVKTEKDGERDRHRDRDRDRERERERERDRERDGKERERDVKPAQAAAKEGGHKVAAAPIKDKYINKPISELDLSNCERCTPSYRLLPKHYPRPVSSHRTALGSSVLNDSWVSVTSGSEDYSFKHMRKNQYEESLFRCEDDRFELDMLLESTSMTAKLVGEYTQKQEEQNGNAEALPPVDEFLSAINMRCIERIYGDHGLDVLEVLRKSTSKAMTVIHSRLVQKEEEWARCREEMNKVWSEVYAKNCYKALDHRSFYFRQQDKKALSTKGLLAEIKEVNERRRAEEDEMMRAVVAGKRRPLLPDLRYEFKEGSIQEDLYQIIKYSSEEISSSPEQTEKTTRMLAAFLNSVFGAWLRLHVAEDPDEDAMGKYAVVLGSDGSAQECGGSEGDESQPDGEGAEREGHGAGVESEKCGPRRGSMRGGGDAIGVCVRGSDGGEANAGRGSEVGNGGGGVGESAEGRMVEEEATVRDSAEENAEGTAARTEGSAGLLPTRSGWLPADNAVGGVQAGNAETDGRSNAGGGENGGSGMVCDGGGLRVDCNAGGGHGRVEREEGELSPSPGVEDRKRSRSKFGSSRGTEENGAAKECGVEEEEDKEGVGGTEMEHDQDADDEGEESAQKSSEESENPSEGGEDVSGSEQSGDEEEHEEEEEEEEEAEGKGESEGEGEGEGEGMADGEDGDGDGDGDSSLAAPENSYSQCKPLSVHGGSAEGLATEAHSKKGGKIFYGNDTFYVLFRLYQTLYERILSAKVNAEVAAKKKGSEGGGPPNLYSRFMQVLYGLLDGSVENSKFEDECRAIIGTQSYILFTLDKLIFKLVKQLQAAGSDEGVQKLLALNEYESGREAGDEVYYADACVVVQEESIYRFEHRSNPSESLIQLMEVVENKDIPGSTVESSFQKYLEAFLCSAAGKKNQPTRKRPALFRRSQVKGKQEGDEMEDVGGERGRGSVRILNGLEIKVSCAKSKVSYVLDTEDLLWRQKSEAASRVVEVRKVKRRRSIERVQQRVQAWREWDERQPIPVNDSASHSDISHGD